MTTIHIQLDDATYARARQAAEAMGRTVEELAAEALAEKTAGSPQPGAGNPILGAFAGEADLVDAVLDDIMRSREQPWRLP